MPFQIQYFSESPAQFTKFIKTIASENQLFLDMRVKTKFYEQSLFELGLQNRKRARNFLGP